MVARGQFRAPPIEPVFRAGETYAFHLKSQLRKRAGFGSKVTFCSPGGTRQQEVPDA